MPPMTTTRAAAGAAVLGGLVWSVAAGLAWGGDVSAVGYAVGLLLFLLSLVGLGYGLVDRAPVWLRALVSIATPALGYAVWTTVRDAFTDDAVPVLAAGIVLLLAGAVVLATGRPAPVEAPVRGRRAAR